MSKEIDAQLITLGLKTYKEGLGYISNTRAAWGGEDLSSSTRRQCTREFPVEPGLTETAEFFYYSGRNGYFADLDSNARA